MPTGPKTSFPSGITGGSAVISDDGVQIVQLHNSNLSGIVAVTDGTGAATRAAVIAFNAGATPAAAKLSGGANAVVLSTALTGTTGTDGNLSIGFNGGQMFVENRTNAERTIAWNFLV